MDDVKKVTVQILNAFTENDKGGNPAGVVLHADALSHENKLEIAQKVGLSETAFISESKTADYKLDFYTPTKQIAHCGHATIAAFSYLKQLGLLKSNTSSKETIDGNRKIEIQKIEDQISALSDREYSPDVSPSDQRELSKKKKKLNKTKRKLSRRLKVK